LSAGYPHVAAIHTMQSLDNRTVQQLKDVVAAAELPKAPPSMSNNAAHVRQELAKDPHNLDLLLSLGEAYTRDGHWNQACNVLHRGWSRLAEVEAGEKRFSYAAAFCESSFRSGRVDVARDALPKLDLAAAAAAVAVGGTQNLKHWDSRRHTLACEIHCAASERQLALKAFCQALDASSTFDDKMLVWAATRMGLRKAGGYDAAKASLSRAADTEEQVQRIDALEDLADGPEEESLESKQNKTRSLVKRLRNLWANWSCGRRHFVTLWLQVTSRCSRRFSMKPPCKQQQQDRSK